MSELQQPEQQQQQQQQQEEEDNTVGDVGCCCCCTCLGGSTRGLQATPGNGKGKGEMAPKIQQATKTGKGGTMSNTGVVVAAESSGKSKGKGADCVSTTTTTTGGKGGQGSTLGKGGKGGDGGSTTMTTATSASKNGKGGKGDTTSGSSSSTCLEAGDDSTAPSVAPSCSTVACPAPVVVRPVLCLSCLDVVPYVCTTAIPVPVV
jgi:hypothetical protein